MSQRETLEEYLARGGEIKRIPPREEDAPDARGVYTVKHNVLPTRHSAGIMSLTDGAAYYAEHKVRVVKKKTPTINASALPPALLKFLPKH